MVTGFVILELIVIFVLTTVYYLVKDIKGSKNKIG